MPMYEYQCRKCGHRFEVIQKFSDAPITQCAKCQGVVEKLVSIPGGLQFKGSGFYINDYARKGNGEKSKETKVEKPETKSADAPAPSSPPSSDSAAKPAAPSTSEPKSKSTKS